MIYRIYQLRAVSMNASNFKKGGIVVALAVALLVAVKVFRSSRKEISATASVGNFPAPQVKLNARSGSFEDLGFDPFLEKARYDLSIDLLDGQIGGIEAREGDDRFRFAAGLPFPNNPVTAFHHQYADGAEAMKKLQGEGVDEKDPRMRDQQVVQDVMARDLELAVNQLISMMKTERETEAKSREWVRQQLSR